MLEHVARFLLSAFLAIGMAGTASAAPGKRVALVIGNADYANIGRLMKPINDAQAVADVLKRLGYEVILGTNAKNGDLLGLAEKFRVGVKSADVGFFYYSGHGFQTNSIAQHPVNHVVPVDFNVDTVDAALATLALDVIIDTLRSQTRLGFIFMDACRNDPQLAAASERLAAGGKSITISRGFSPINVAEERRPTVQPRAGKEPTGLLIAYATDPGNVALEGDIGILSPFTSALVKHIGTPGLSAAEVMGRVSQDVSLQTAGKQTPWNVSSLTAGTYQFVPKPERIIQPSSTPGPRATPPPAAPRQEPRQPKAPFQLQ